MAPTLHESQKQPFKASIKLPSAFIFPDNCHLLITTSSHIWTWDSSGINTIFQSSKYGIVAAREAPDGSGMLAVANKHVVILHDTKRGQEQSWGLEGRGDEIRHLEYTVDAKSLFVSTSLTNDIQRYSTDRARLLCPTRTLASPPVALSVSPKGDLMVSASDHPPVVYLQNLAHHTAPVLIEPRASKAAVSVAAFHPERSNIFLLAFQDGTIAAYDATKVTRSGDGSISDQTRVNKGEISHLMALHRPAPVENQRTAITGAAFFPGFKTRAVSVGSDGRCRLIDFADGGVILRTWRAKAPVTSVSVSPSTIRTQSLNSSAGNKPADVVLASANTENLIAIGRADGGIHVYDSRGSLLTQRSATEKEEKIISVEWARGPSPKQIVGTSIPSLEKDLPRLCMGGDEKIVEKFDKAKQSPAPPPGTTTAPRRDTMFENVGLPPELRKPKSQTPNQTTSGPPRKFTIHPDEVEGGTVRHIPLPPDSKLSHVGERDYLDLFSPVKSPESKTKELPEKRIASPSRSRPAITSQTFIKSPDPTPTTRHDTVTRRRNLALFPSTDSCPEIARTLGADTKIAKHATATNLTPPEERRHITFREDTCRSSRRAISRKSNTAQQNNNAKVLADLRKMGAIPLSKRPGSTLSSAVPAKTAPEETTSEFGRTESKLRFLRRPVDHIETHHDSDTAHQIYDHAHNRRHWPEDSNQDASLGSNDDIWLTSELNDDMAGSRRHKQNVKRPPARQTSRSKVDSKGTISTLAQQPADSASVSAHRIHRMDGSTEDEMFTADTHVSTSGTLSPSSKDVREIFPRSSSLWPQKRRKSENRAQRRAHARGQNLREITQNEVAGRLVKSPWERARAGKSAPKGFMKAGKETNVETIHVFEDSVNATEGQKQPPGEAQCAMCRQSKARVQELEAELGRVKGEVLVLKAVLRRQGKPLPSPYSQ